MWTQYVLVMSATKVVIFTCLQQHPEGCRSSYDADENAVSVSSSLGMRKERDIPSSELR